MTASASLLVFFGTLVAVLSLMYAFVPTTANVGQRLQQVWQRSVQGRQSRTAEKLPFAQKQKERMKNSLARVGKLIPGSVRQLSQLQRMMLRAGYRRPELVMVLRGTKFLLSAGLLALVYFSGAYAANPISYLALAGIGGYILPDMLVMWRVRRRAHRLRIGLPDALDLMVVCVEAGLGLDQAILRVAHEIRLVHPDLSEEFQLVNLQMRVGKKRSEAFRELADRTAVDDIKALVGMLVQSDRFGTSVAQSLRVHSEELRIKRRQRAQEAAAKTPVKMVPALVFFIFPALFVVILGPAVISLVRDLLPAMR